MVLSGASLEALGECWELGWGMFGNIGRYVGSYGEIVGIEVGLVWKMLGVVLGVMPKMLGVSLASTIARCSILLGVSLVRT